MLKVADDLGRVIVTKPPEPVGPFADSQLLHGGCFLLRIEAAVVHHPVEVGFGFTEQIPGPVLVRVTDPGGERAVNPAAGHKMRQMNRRGYGVRHQIGISGQSEPGVVCQYPIKFVEEVKTVLGVILPGIFAIHDHGNHRLRLALGLPRNVFHVMHQVANGIPGVPVCVSKTDQIRQTVVTEEDGGIRFAERIGLVNPGIGQIRVVLPGQIEAVVHHRISAGSPSELMLIQQAQCGLAETTLGSPAAGGINTEEALKNGPSLLELPCGARFTLRVMAVCWQSNIRHGLAGSTQVDQQREHGMGIGADRQLHLPFLRKMPVPWADAG